MPTVQVNPDLLLWAIDRSGLSRDELGKVFTKLDDWLSGEREPTFRQLQDFARRTMTPFGMLLLSEPPIEELGIPDFRTVGDSKVSRPSPNLLATIDEIRRRQNFIRDLRIEEGFEQLSFVASREPQGNIVSAAQQIRQQLGLTADWAQSLATWEDALTQLRRCSENIGILVFSNSVVGNNNHRPLDPEEFRGFVFVDKIAPTIFLNDGDSKSARMFTLAHELVHVWIGKDALVNLANFMPAHDATERFCNTVAAELLVPKHKMLERWDDAQATAHPFTNIGRWFKVSPVVAARRALDLGLIDETQFFQFYRADRAAFFKRKKAEKEKGGGGNFYATQASRLGRPFADAVVRSVREGRLLYNDAHRLLGMKGDTFNKFAGLVLERTKNERQ
jgi:Zn-dependent peptidase ImmA (M78 family)